MTKTKMERQAANAAYEEGRRLAEIDFNHPVYEGYGVWREAEDHEWMSDVQLLEKRVEVLERQMERVLGERHTY